MRLPWLENGTKRHSPSTLVYFCLEVGVGWGVLSRLQSDVLRVKAAQSEIRMDLGCADPRRRIVNRDYR